MRLELEFYGPVQDAVGCARKTVDLDAAPSSRDALIAALSDKLDAGHGLSNPHLRLAINDEIAAQHAPLDLKDGDRVALLSPFSGG